MLPHLHNCNHHLNGPVSRCAIAHRNIVCPLSNCAREPLAQLRSCFNRKFPLLCKRSLCTIVPVVCKGTNNTFTVIKCMLLCGVGLICPRTVPATSQAQTHLPGVYCGDTCSRVPNFQSFCISTCGPQALDHILIAQVWVPRMGTMGFSEGASFAQLHKVSSQLLQSIICGYSRTSW